MFVCEVNACVCVFVVGLFCSLFQDAACLSEASNAPVFGLLKPVP